MQGFVSAGDVEHVTIPGGGWSSGDGVRVGAVFGVALADGTAGNTGALQVRGKMWMLKSAPLVISQGDALYWNDTTGVTKTTTDYGPIGIASEAAGSAAVLVLVNVGVALSPLEGSIETAEIAADAVTGAKIADDAVDSEHIVAGAIDTAHIADDQVTNAKLGADCVTGAELADDCCDSEHYTDGSIDTAHIADDQITNAKLGADCVTGAEIADDAVDSEHYVDGSVDAAHLSADCVNGTKIADDSIDSEHYVDGSIDTAHIADAQVTTGKLAVDAAAGNLVTSTGTIDCNQQAVQMGAQVTESGGELTIAAGVIAVTAGVHTVDTEADAATDNLDTINTAVATTGMELLLSAENVGRVVTIRSGAGNIQTTSGEDINLNDAGAVLLHGGSASGWMAQAPVYTDQIAAVLDNDVDAEYLANEAVTGVVGVGVPFVIRVDCEAAAAVIEVYNANAPFDFEILSAIAVCTAANGGGTAKLNDAAGGGGNDITDAMVMAVQDAAIVNTQLFWAQRAIATGGDLSVVKNAAGDDGYVIINCVRT